MILALNPELDLVLQREVDVMPEEIWHAWTTPEHLKDRSFRTLAATSK